jgi:hypothetical protein
MGEKRTETAGLQVVYLGSWEHAPWVPQAVPGAADPDGWDEILDLVPPEEDQWLSLHSREGYFRVGVALGKGDGIEVWARGMPAALELLERWATILLRLRELRASFGQSAPELTPQQPGD